MAKKPSLKEFYDVTELEKLTPERVDAVGSPANGISFLVLKSSADEAVGKSFSLGAPKPKKGSTVSSQSSKELKKALKKLNALRGSLDEMATKQRSQSLFPSAAMLRGPSGGGGVFAALDRDFEAAKARFERDPGDPSAAVAMQSAGQRRALAKLISVENARDRDPRSLHRRTLGLGVPIVGNSHALPEDRELRYAGGGAR